MLSDLSVPTLSFSFDEDPFDIEVQSQHAAASSSANGRAFKKLSPSEYLSNKEQIAAWREMAKSPEIDDNARNLATKNLYKYQLANLRSDYSTVYERSLKSKAEIERVQAQLQATRTSNSQPLPSPRDPRLPQNVPHPTEELMTLKKNLADFQLAFVNAQEDTARLRKELQALYQMHDEEKSQWKCQKRKLEEDFWRHADEIQYLTLENHQIARNLSQADEIIDGLEKRLRVETRDDKVQPSDGKLDCFDQLGKRLKRSEKELKQKTEFTLFLADENAKLIEQNAALKEQVQKLQEEVKRFKEVH